MTIQPGAFVWTHFPMREEPHKPGLRHLAYCFGVGSSRLPGGSVRAAVVYTTTTIPPRPHPIGIRVFSVAEARALGQRPFALNVGTIAYLPLHRIWFPELNTPSQGVVGIAPAGLQRELSALLNQVFTRYPDLIDRRGPGVS